MPRSPERKPLPYGGKALLRMLQLLEAAGYREPAANAVYAAVPDAAVEEFASVVAPFTADPARKPTAPLNAARRTRARGRRGGGAAEDVARAFIEAAAPQTGPQPQGQGAWRSIGPTTIPNGQTYGASRVNVSGRVSSIAVDPGDGAHVLVGAANGGVWETRDRGATWAPRTDDQRTLAVGAVTYDPQDRTLAYCGTGEGNWWSWLGAGVLLSKDGGTTWDVLCTDPFLGQGFYDLEVDPKNGSNLVAGTTEGLWLSRDGGLTWDVRRNVRTWSVSYATGGGTVEILAACQDGLFSSTDEGATWTPVALPGAPPSYARLATVISRSKGRTAYAWGASGSTAFLWRRKGGNWAAIAPPPGVDVGQAWYDWFLEVAPDRDTRIYCGAISGWRGEVGGASPTWTDIVTKQVGDSIHPDQHALAFEPGNPSAIYVGNDGGLFRSKDRGDTWVHCNNGLVISEFEYLAQDKARERWLMGGTQDNGTARWEGKPVWTHIADGDGGDCGVNQTTPATVFHTYYGMSPERSTTHGDFGSWTDIGPPVPAGEGSLFYPPFECSEAGGNTVAMGGEALYVSRDNGATWTRLAYPNAATGSAMYIPDDKTVFVGTTDGRIFRTKWSGGAWSGLVALTTPRAGAYVSDLWIDRKLRYQWATYTTIGGGRVFRSANGGSTWTDCSAGLPELPINAVAVHSGNTRRLWVAADVGVYQSLDRGGTWSPFSNGLPNAYVGDLAFHPKNGLLRAGTRNRGVWQTRT